MSMHVPLGPALRRYFSMSTVFPNKSSRLERNHSCACEATSTSAPEGGQSLQNLRNAQRFRSRQKRLDRIIWRLEKKIYGSPTAENGSYEKQILHERMLEDTIERRSKLDDLDLSKADVAARRLLLLSQDLGLDPNILAQVSEINGQVLNIQPFELRSRIALLSNVLGLQSPADLLDLSLKHPTLLTRPSQSLAKNIPELAALLKSRGMDIRAMARKQPDLLLQNAGTVRLKMDALPAALDLPPRRAREVISECPQLLRRSASTVHERLKLLQKLFDSVPRNFLSELICKDPRILCFSSKTLSAKFSSLMSKYGSFQADVVDMILVDPNVLLKMPVLTSINSASLSYPEQQQQKQKALSVNVDVKKPGTPALTGTGRLLALASAFGAPLIDVLKLCASPNSKVHEWSPAESSQKISALASVLGITLQEAKGMVKSQLRLLEVSGEVLQQRAVQLAELFGPSRLSAFQRSASTQIPADSTAGISPELHVPPIAITHPDLLLREPEALQELLQEVAKQLNMPLARVPALIQVVPALILEPSKTFTKLQTIQQLLGDVSSNLVLELITKEPGILKVSPQELTAVYEELASSFGSFREDALQLILADPSVLLKGIKAEASFSQMDCGGEAPSVSESVQKKKGRKENKRTRKDDGGKRRGGSDYDERPRLDQDSDPRSRGRFREQVVPSLDLAEGGRYLRR
ncbi:hypothetical protein CEUSTIGMA_g6900.t1 [Chlamydomonas eustigma]|uniref:Uncharacterized protein n=1 Tax=Chlamydomonas eustigma TaxID=1157962 RepID=A0A250X975_9CHLO|nr:hypothetical protein CEUSTIGMA_g6900.t1 [Chlamydomonas eustigma]|eukprot:GAX79459.1 hypothetical protein CEUSTIGMA_g6900.t1 [Chlamydomonas eustigma]